MKPKRTIDKPSPTELVEQKHEVARLLHIGIAKDQIAQTLQYPLSLVNKLADDPDVVAHMQYLASQRSIKLAKHRDAFDALLEKAIDGLARIFSDKKAKPHDISEAAKLILDRHPDGVFAPQTRTTVKSLHRHRHTHSLEAQMDQYRQRAMQLRQTAIPVAATPVPAVEASRSAVPVAVEVVE